MEICRQDYKETMDYVGNKYRLIILIICLQFKQKITLTLDTNIIN